MPGAGVEISAIDYRLLSAFDAVMTDLNISRAAKRLGVTQSAVSQAIAKMRDLVDDDLFERTGHGVRPTPRAMELAEPVAQALAILRNAFGPPPQFDPAVS